MAGLFHPKVFENVEQLAGIDILAVRVHVLTYQPKEFLHCEDSEKVG